MYTDSHSEFIANVLLGDYLKLARVDLMTGNFEFLKLDSMLHDDSYANADNIYAFIRQQVEDGIIISSYSEEYLRFSDAKYVQKRVFSGERRIVQTYKRKTSDGSGMWVTFAIISSADCTPEHPYAVFSWRETDTDVRMLHEERQELVENCYRDALTLLYNRHQFNEDLEKFRENEGGRLTCLYIDLNGLHEMNNHLGHTKGDDMLRSVADGMKRLFPEEKNYRIGGDEFVMLSQTLSKSSTEQLTAKLRQVLAEDNYMISAGIESAENTTAVYQVVGAAELAMRQDKENYYKQGGGQRRRRIMNAELEQMLIEKHDAEYFLRLIATKYAAVYFVDMKRDTLRYIYIPQYFTEILEKTDFCYSRALQSYMEKYVSEEYHRIFREFTDYENLSMALKKEDVLSLSYKKADGSFMDLRVLETDRQSEEQHETVWIFSK